MRISLHSHFARQVLSAGIAILALTFTGWITTSMNASRLCVGWPLCLPSESLGWLQWIHRASAGIAAILTLLIFQSAWQGYRHHLLILPLTTLLAVMFFGQVFVGALEATKPAPHLVILHTLTSVSIWIALIVLIFSASVAPSSEPASSKFKDFLILTKPWIVALLLVTTFAGLVVGYRGIPPLSVVFWTLLGGALAAGGSSALNQCIDQEVDRHMQRTAQRPLAAGRLTRADGLAFGLALCVASYFILAGMVNLLAAILSLIGIFYYVFIYSIWLKKVTVQNIVIGGGAGALPPMVGWAAATGHLPLTAWILFAIIFIWTPPHFWALAIVRKKDYERAGIPMLPVVRGEEETRRQILIYTLALVGVSLLLPALGLAGSFYLVAALVFGSGLIYAAWRVWRVRGNRVAYLMYRWSSLYLLFIFIALMLDAVHGHS